MDNPIVLSNINKTYGDSKTPAVVNFSLTINRGEFICLIGPSGCGKSTVLKMIAGLEKPTSGQIIKPAHVGMVFQSGALLPWLTVEENIAFAARMYGFSKEKVRSVTSQYVTLVHLEKFKNKFPRELSGGQRQRVGVARALAIQTEVLLLDEPFSALDPMTTEELHADLLYIWQSTKKTIVMVSHLLEEAVALSDRIGVIKNGMLKSIISIPLSRPRDVGEKDFIKEVKKVKELLIH